MAGSVPDYYEIDGVRVVTDGDARARAAVAARLWRYRISPGSHHDARFVYVRTGARPAPAQPPAGRARQVCAQPGFAAWYTDDGDRLFISCGDAARAVCRAGTGQVRVSLYSAAANEITGTGPLLLLPLSEIMARRGRFRLHAGCVAIEGRCLLLAGLSGAGKTTLTLALLRTGASYLSDDTVFLVRGAAGPRVIALTEDAGLDADAARRLPETAPFLEVPPACGVKVPLRPEAVYGSPAIPEATPAALVLPRVARAGASALTRISPAQALRELACNVLLTHPPSAQAHLDLLGEVVRGVPCYRLDTGPDLDAAARMLLRLIA